MMDENRKTDLYEKYKDDPRNSQDERIICLDCKELFKRNNEDDKICTECFDYDNFTNEAIR